MKSKSGSPLGVERYPFIGRGDEFLQCGAADSFDAVFTDAVSDAGFRLNEIQIRRTPSTLAGHEILPTKRVNLLCVTCNDRVVGTSSPLGISLGSNMAGLLSFTVTGLRIRVFTREWARGGDNRGRTSPRGVSHTWYLESSVLLLFYDEVDAAVLLHTVFMMLITKWTIFAIACRLQLEGETPLLKVRFDAPRPALTQDDIIGRSPDFIASTLQQQAGHSVMHEPLRIRF